MPFEFQILVLRQFQAISMFLPCLQIEARDARDAAASKKSNRRTKLLSQHPVKKLMHFKLMCLAALHTCCSNYTCQFHGVITLAGCVCVCVFLGVPGCVCVWMHWCVFRWTWVCECVCLRGAVSKMVYVLLKPSFSYSFQPFSISVSLNICTSFYTHFIFYQYPSL